MGRIGRGEGRGPAFRHGCIHTASALIAGSLLGACATSLVIPPRCDLDPASRTLTIAGDIDEDFGACVAAHADVVDILRVDTLGGDVRVALEAADAMLDGGGYTLVVERWCGSSCANYLLPAARRVVVEPDARIYLHGSVDTGLVDRDFADRPEERTDIDTVVASQQAFRERHDIHRGWWLERTAEDYRENRLGAYLKGSPRNWDGTRAQRVGGLIATPAFTASCLPDLDIVWSGGGTFTPKTRRRLDDNAFADTSDMRCVD